MAAGDDRRIHALAPAVLAGGLRIVLDGPGLTEPVQCALDDLGAWLARPEVYPVREAVPLVGEWPLILKAPFDMTLKGVTDQLAGGSLTYSVKVGGSVVPWLSGVSPSAGLVDRVPGGAAAGGINIPAGTGLSIVYAGLASPSGLFVDLVLKPGLSGVSALPPAPTLGALTPLAQLSNWTAGISLSGHSSAAGSLGLAVIGRASSTPASPPNVTWGSGAMTLLNYVILGGAGNCFAIIYALRGGAPGAQAVTLTPNATSQYGRLQCFAFDLLGWGGLVSTPVPGNRVNAAGTTSIAAPHTREVANELMVAVGGAVDGTVSPISVSAGFAKLAEARTGATTFDVDAVLGTKGAAAAGIAESVTFSSATAVAAWAAVAVGFRGG